MLAGGARSESLCSAGSLSSSRLPFDAQLHNSPSGGTAHPDRVWCDPPVAQPALLSPAELKLLLDTLRAGSALYYRGPDGSLQIAALTGDQQLVIGRRSSCTIALPWDRSVSRLHAVLHPLGSEWAIEDAGLSRNGTFVNGVRVTRLRRLADGDAILAGETVLTFRGQAGAPGENTDTFVAAPGQLAVTVAQRRVLESLCRPMTAAEPDALPASNRQIAEELVLSEETVKSHMRALSQLFEVDQLPQSQRRIVLARKAIAAGLVARR